MILLNLFFRRCNEIFQCLVIRSILHFIHVVYHIWQSIQITSEMPEILIHKATQIRSDSAFDLEFFSKDPIR